jgi:uncharacterized protein (PEP-CTERM system associated)
MRFPQRYPTRLALLSALSGLLVAGPAVAETTQVTTGLTVRGLLTDNARLAPSDEDSAFILEASPNISVRRTAGRLKLSGNMELQGFKYFGIDAGSRVMPNLSLDGTGELADNLFFVDVNAQVRQQNISAVRQSVDNALPSDDRAEVRAFRVSPYLRGRFANDTDWTLRYTLSRFSTDAATATNSTQHEVSAQASGGTGVTGLSWGANVSQRRSDYGGGATRSNFDGTTYLASLSYRFSPQWVASARAGYERNTVLASGRAGNRYGVGLGWNPTDRTTITADYDKRSFGNSYAYAFNHRTARTGLRLSYTSDVRTLTEELLGVGIISGNDVFLSFFNSGAFASIEDPAQREAAVIAFMQSVGLWQNGQPVGLAVPLNFISNRTFTERRLRATFSYAGRRNSLVISAYRSRRDDVSSGFTTSDDLAAGLGVDSSTVSVNLGHRLTPITSANLTVSRSKGATVIGGDGDSIQHRYDLALSTRLRKDTSATVGLRHVTLDGSSDYTENAVMAALGITF